MAVLVLPVPIGPDSKRNPVWKARSASSDAVFPTISDNPAIKVDVYPNPFHNQTNIMIHATQSLQGSTMLVFSIDGKKVDELPIGEGTMHSITVNSLAPGTYIWSLVQGEKILARGKWVIE